MFDCVDYTRLFQNQKVVNDIKNTSFVEKTQLTDVIYPIGKCFERISTTAWIILIIVIVFWLFRALSAIYNIARYSEIKSFYSKILNIQTKDLTNLTWHEVQEKLLQMQKKHQFCVHKQELTELDIYNRILRFKNYQVAMVNQGLLPAKFTLPILGTDLICLTSGFKYNFEFLFFWGPFAPFTNGYQLRPEFKVFSKRADLTRELSRSILLLGLFNLLLAPVIFIWQLLQFVYNYTELIKRDPAVLGMRKWSNYGRLYFRHFNELDHELDARLSRAYKPAVLYLSSFVSKFLVVCAKFVLITFGAVFAVLVVLTIWDEDVLNVEHVLTIISVSGAVAGLARSLIPDENAVIFMDQMMYQILAQVHYMPDLWKTHANSYLVRDEFVKLFQYKFVYLIEELVSPLMTPIILLFWLRPRASKLVDFLRNFTVDVVGVGDVCSFSQMDTRRHGNPTWLSKNTQAKKQFQARNGKTELSLIHFTHTNPNWKMPNESMAFMDNLRDQAVKEQQQQQHQQTTSSVILDNHNSLNRSLYHLQSLVYNNSANSNLLKSNINQQQQIEQSFFVGNNNNNNISSCSGQMPRGAVNKIEGPIINHNNSNNNNKTDKQTLLTIAQASALQLSQTQQSILPLPTPSITTALENSLDMCFSALYMHELHRKYHPHNEYLDLDNLKEEEEEQEQDDDDDDDNNNNNNTINNDDNIEDQSYNNGGGGPSRQPLLLTNNKKLNNNNNNKDKDIDILNNKLNV
jgi:autophagy-related protein 9